MISVILTTYERRELLARALASVLAQTLTDREVIVVDDGSTDGTVEFLAAQPVTGVRIAHSRNPAVVRNAGLKRAQGELITFLDSDDVWQPTALTELAGALLQHPDAGFAYCDFQPQVSSMPKSAGAIDIFDHFTFVEVPAGSAGDVMAMLNRTKWQGTRLQTTPARPRSG